MDKEKKKILRRKLAWISLKIFTTLCGKFPLSQSYRWGKLAGKLAYYLAVRHRKIALETLMIAFPFKSRKDREKIAKEFFVFMAQSSLETLFFLKNLDCLDNIRIEGKVFLDNALKKKKGVIILSAHLGNFPLISLKLAKLGYPVWVMARPMRDQKAGDYLHKLRTKAKVRTIFSYPRRECVAQTIKVLRDNEIIMIQIDQNFGTGGVWVRFFGRLAATPIGPIVFTLRTDCQIVPCYIKREGIGRHVIKFFPSLELEKRNDKDETILINAIKFTHIIEDWVKDNPLEWSWIHRRWKSHPSGQVMKMKFKVQKD